MKRGREKPTPTSGTTNSTGTISSSKKRRKSNEKNEEEDVGSAVSASASASASASVSASVSIESTSAQDESDKVLLPKGRRGGHGGRKKTNAKRVESASSELEGEEGHQNHDDLENNDDEDDDDEGSDEDGEDVPCAVCEDADATSKNHIIMCDGPGCDIPVHQVCYRVDKIPPGDEKWFCHRCEDGVAVDDTEAICCNVKTGAFVRTTFPKKYIHLQCALWNTSVELLKTGAYTVEKWMINKETCCMCSSTHGLTIRCKYAGCKKWFHVSCAVDAGMIEPCRPRDIKHNVMCGSSHTETADLPPINTTASASTTAPAAPIKKKEEIGEGPVKKKREVGGLLPPTSRKSNDRPPPGTALSWLMEKVGVLKEVSEALENIPPEFKRAFGSASGPSTTTTSAPPPLPSAKVNIVNPLDSIFDNAIRKSTDNLSDQVAVLQKQLASRPTQEEVLKLKQELALLKSTAVSATTPVYSASPVLNLLPPPKPEEEGDVLDLCVAVFNRLEMPGDFVPVTRSTLRPFVTVLHALLERDQNGI